MNYYNQIKEKLIDKEIYDRVKDYSKERNKLKTYFEVGKLLIEAQGGEARAKYGDGLIKEYSEKLVVELDKKYNITSLKRMRQFYTLIEKGATLSHQLGWSHYVELLPLSNINEINYYINASIKQNLSVRDLRERIRNKEYERLDDKTKNKLLRKEKTSITDFVKNPIIIRNPSNKEVLTEKALKMLILEDIDYFLSELGEGYLYVGNEYKIMVGDKPNYIDILLFNYIYNSFVVVELKITKLKKEHIGQIGIYMNYIDKHVRRINHNKTIGIIISKVGNEYLMSYCSDNRILSRRYLLK